jgi:hypothetical protein
MAPESFTHSWLGNFAGRLLQLRPDLSAVSAVHCAVENIHRSSDIDPQRAAELVVDAAEPQSTRYRDQFSSRPAA